MVKVARDEVRDLIKLKHETDFTCTVRTPGTFLSVQFLAEVRGRKMGGTRDETSNNRR